MVINCGFHAASRPSSGSSHSGRRPSTPERCGVPSTSTLVGSATGHGPTNGGAATALPPRTAATTSPNHFIARPLLRQIPRSPLQLVRRIGIAETDADACTGLLGFGAGNGIGAIIRGVEGAWAVVAGEADAAEGCVGRCAICGLIPVDHAGADVCPEAVVELGALSDQRGGDPEADSVGLAQVGIESG